MAKRGAEVVDRGTVVFLGPTLPWQEAWNLLPARYIAPAQMGDVYALIGSGIERIVLIDGLFGGVPSIWQRELLTAVDLGIEVWGCSSMGALRAAELHTLGLLGHGQIFAAYRDGLISNDDEVVLKHESGFPFRALTVPLVNIRHGLALAVAAGLVGPEHGAVLLDCAAEIPYEQRSLIHWFEASAQRLGDSICEPFRAFWLANQPDLKAEDARSLLALLALPSTTPRSCSAAAPQGCSLDRWSSTALMMRHCTTDVQSAAAGQLTTGHLWLKTRVELRQQATAVAIQLWLLDLALASDEHPSPSGAWLSAYQAAWKASLAIAHIALEGWCVANALSIAELEGELQRRANLYWRLLSPPYPSPAKLLSRADENAFLARVAALPPTLRWCLIPQAIEDTPALSLIELVQRSMVRIHALLLSRGLRLGNSAYGSTLAWADLQHHWCELPARLGYHDWDGEAQGLRVLQVCGLLAP